MRTSPAALLLVAGMTLTGCASTQPAEQTEAPARELLDSTEQVCDEFAAYAKAGQPKAGRADVVASIGEVIGNADQQLQDNYTTLTSSVDAPESQWELSADVFAQTCFDTGWTG